MDQNKNDFFFEIEIFAKTIPHTPYKVQSDKYRS